MNSHFQAKRFALCLLFGILIAVSTSIKLPAILLLPLPIIMIGGHLLGSQFLWRNAKHAAISIQSAIAAGISIVGSFSLVFLFLEPELWDRPLKGMVFLFGSRILQQERFYIFFGRLSLIELSYRLPQVFLPLPSNTFLWIGLTSALVVGTYTLLKSAEKKLEFRILCLIGAYIICSNLTYARLPFNERYLIPGIFIFAAISAFGFHMMINAGINNITAIIAGKKKQKIKMF